MKPWKEGCSNDRMLSGAVFALLFSGLLNATEAPIADGWPEEEEDWSVSQVNEGQLQFIEPVLDRTVLHSDTRLKLTASSLQTGWVDMHQCYRNLDAVDKTEIVYTYREMENLRVTRAENIGHYRSTPRAVELGGVEQGAELCLQARVRVLRRLSNQRHGMSHGPYHRRFLDGYYPYHLSLTVQYPQETMRVERVEPPARRGFEVNDIPAGLAIESWFEGELTIEIEFTER